MGIVNKMITVGFVIGGVNAYNWFKGPPANDKVLYFRIGISALAAALMLIGGLLKLVLKKSEPSAD